MVKNQFNILKILVKDLDANINIKTKNGVSPILLAIKGHKTEIMRWLLLNDCDVTTRDTSKQSILHYAVQSGLEILNTVLRYKIEINSNDSIEKTPLFYAVELGNLKAVDILLK